MYNGCTKWKGWNFWSHNAILHRIGHLSGECGQFIPWLQHTRTTGTPITTGIRPCQRCVEQTDQCYLAFSVPCLYNIVGNFLHLIIRHNNGLANELSSTYQGTSWIPPASRRRNAVVVRLKKRENPEDYPSAVACHLASNKECCLSYDDSDFRVLARCRSKHHLNILEAMYIHVLKPVLCKQKSFVANLTLFKHAHSTHSHKHTE